MMGRPQVLVTGAELVLGGIFQAAKNFEYAGKRLLSRFARQNL